MKLEEINPDVLEITYEEAFKELSKICETKQDQELCSPHSCPRCVFAAALTAFKYKLEHLTAEDVLRELAMRTTYHESGGCTANLSREAMSVITGMLESKVEM